MHAGDVESTRADLAVSMAIPGRLLQTSKADD
jgi:hypothetical protein